MPMRRAALAALLLAVATADTASALAPGAPRHVRTARPADEQPRAGAPAEDWTLELVDPRSKAYAALRVFRDPNDGRRARLELRRGKDGFTDDYIVYPPAISHSGRAWTIRFSSETSDGEIRLKGARAGVTAQRWGLGREAGFAEHVTMSWATPVATARATGHIRMGTQTVDIGGWRGSLEHRWGTYARSWHAWDHAGTGLIHTRGGSAWMLLGLNRRDYLTGAGARDAFWLGLLVRVTARGTSFCRPRIVRRRWLVSIDGPVAVERVTASCGGLRRVRFTRIDDTALPGSSFGEFGDESRARARPAGAAWIRYAGHGTR
jgi:hypothetical protein